MDRKFDLTAGSEYVDCNLHCPSSKLRECKPHFQYDFGGENNKDQQIDGPFCSNLNAPLSGENESRVILKKPITQARRICIYWDELLSHSP